MGSTFLTMKLIGLTLALAQAYASPERELTIAELVEKDNQLPKTWTAGVSAKFRGDAYPSDFSKLMGSLEIPAGLDLPVRNMTKNLKAVPDYFHPADEWPQCADVLAQVRDQGSCGSCWAFGAAEAFTDRACIQTGTKVDYSAEDILGCCRTCGMGCNGGYTAQTWNYMMSHGVCTGGLYDGEGCKPYSIQPCVHHSDSTDRVNCEELDMEPTPSCKSYCDDSSHHYESDKIYLSSAYKVSRVVSQIQQELMENGPLEASFTVYDDFMSYTGGVYHHVTGRSKGGHAVKLMGWGTDAEEGDYWLLANSWNSDWGENGFFRMRRGTNECGIEAGLYGGNFWEN